MERMSAVEDISSSTDGQGSNLGQQISVGSPDYFFFVLASYAADRAILSAAKNLLQVPNRERKGKYDESIRGWIPTEVILKPGFCMENNRTGVRNYNPLTLKNQSQVARNQKRSLASIQQDPYIEGEIVVTKRKRSAKLNSNAGRGSPIPSTSRSACDLQKSKASATAAVHRGKKIQSVLNANCAQAFKQKRNVITKKGKEECTDILRKELKQGTRSSYMGSSEWSSNIECTPPVLLYSPSLCNLLEHEISATAARHRSAKKAKFGEELTVFMSKNEREVSKFFLEKKAKSSALTCSMESKSGERRSKAEHTYPVLLVSLPCSLCKSRRCALIYLTDEKIIAVLEHGGWRYDECFEGWLSPGFIEKLEETPYFPDREAGSKNYDPLPFQRPSQGVCNEKISFCNLQESKASATVHRSKRMQSIMKCNCEKKQTGNSKIIPGGVTKPSTRNGCAESNNKKRGKSKNISGKITKPSTQSCCVESKNRRSSKGKGQRSKNIKLSEMGLLNGLSQHQWNVL